MLILVGFFTSALMVRVLGLLLVSACLFILMIILMRLFGGSIGSGEFGKLHQSNWQILKFINELLIGLYLQ